MNESQRQNNITFSLFPRNNYTHSVIDRQILLLKIKPLVHVIQYTRTDVTTKLAENRRGPLKSAIFKYTVIKYSRDVNNKLHIIYVLFVIAIDKMRKGLLTVCFENIVCIGIIDSFKEYNHILLMNYFLQHDYLKAGNMT